MKTIKLQKVALAIAGMTALSIGISIFASPQAFYASYGITVGTNPDLLSELRAPAANLAALGSAMLVGIFVPAWRRVSSTVALIVFVAFPLGRITSLLLDGMPTTGILGALIIEVLVGVLCAVAFWPRTETARPDTRVLSTAPATERSTSESSSLDRAPQT
jgi:hypothetical protein